MTFVSRWFKAGEGKNSRQAAPMAVSSYEAARDSSVAFVAGEGAKVYSLAAWRTLKNLPPSQPNSAA
jgi:hypothetical protein